MAKLFSCFLFILLLAVAAALSTEPPRPVQQSAQQQPNRRGFLSASLGFVVTATGAATFVPPPACAFENKISDKYDDRPKRRGPQPKDLGIGVRTTLEGDEYVGLKSCGAAPNCFSSTISLDDDADHSIPPWSWPDSLENQQAAFEELRDVLMAYKPGQNGVDGGGFEMKTFDPVNGYIYVQFEALKNGYIDDVELAVIPGRKEERTVHVRSSSRIGYLDFGVNGKRLNYIANALRAKGWKAEGVNPKTHAFYMSENERM